MERKRASSSLHQRIEGALSRAALAQENSRVLVAECRHVSGALRETLDALHRGQEARAPGRHDGRALRN